MSACSSPLPFLFPFSYIFFWIHNFLWGQSPCTLSFSIRQSTFQAHIILFHPFLPLQALSFTQSSSSPSRSSSSKHHLVHIDSTHFSSSSHLFSTSNALHTSLNSASSPSLPLKTYPLLSLFALLSFHYNIQPLHMLNIFWSFFILFTSFVSFQQFFCTQASYKPLFLRTRVATHTPHSHYTSYPHSTHLHTNHHCSFCLSLHSGLPYTTQCTVSSLNSYIFHFFPTYSNHHILQIPSTLHFHMPHTPPVPPPTHSVRHSISHLTHNSFTFFRSQINTFIIHWIPNHAEHSLR